MGMKSEIALPQVLVTGANGFIGSVLCRELEAGGYPVRAAVRRPDAVSAEDGAVEYLPVGPLEHAVDWKPLLEGVDTIIHLAGVAHYLGPHDEAMSAHFHRINVEATRALAAQAAAAGVRRFIYLSSIKVNGEVTEDRSFQVDDPPRPEGIYGESKLRAEQALQAICEEQKMEWVIIRPTLVYGPNARGNLQRLMGLISAGLPLPFGAIDNRRSMIGISNLCDLIRTCITHPKAPGHVFLAADGEDISTPELVRRLAGVLGRPTRLVPIPPALLRAMGRIIGRGEEMQRLTLSLQVDISQTTELLDWTPPVCLNEGLKGLFAD